MRGAARSRGIVTVQYHFCVKQKARKRAANGVGRPTIPAAAALRQRILDAATEEFLAHGYSGASVERIAAASGAGKPTIYRHFADKRGLFETVCRLASATLRADLDALAEDPRPPELVLPQFARVIYDAHAHRVMTSLGRITVFEALRAPEVSEAVFDQAAEAFKGLERYLARQAAAGTLQIGDAAIAAAQFGALVDGGIRGFAITDATRRRERERWLEASVALFLAATRRPAADPRAAAARRAR